MSRLTELSRRLFINIEEIFNSWSSIFGDDFINVWQDVSPIPKWQDTSYALQKIVQETKNVLDMNKKRNGHVSLFIRDPLSDRLILINSTNKVLNPCSDSADKAHYVKKLEENYDKEQQVFFYKLCDRLPEDDDKSSESSRETRGLTGWVAVTGFPLRINSERAKTRLEDIKKDFPQTQQMCAIYGTPVWGNRIAEFPENLISDWSKRFLAVPIKSVYDSTEVIGILRYTCMLDHPELTQLDLQYIESIAEIIAAIKNLERIKNLTTRDIIFPQKLANFKKTSFFFPFLEFIAISLRSKIASLYIYLNCNDKPVLRLLDAYGISGSINELRILNKVNDYTPKTKGLTWDLLENCPNSSKVYNSVINSNCWRGLNTKIFYEKALSNLGISDICVKLEDQWKKKELLESYSIKLIGMGLKENNNPVGVLKVEFPSTFDEKEYYNEIDQKFFERCGSFLKQELIEYQNFINGKWFKDADEKKVVDFTRLLNQIIHIQLIKPKNKESDNIECPSFWENVENYINKHTKLIKDTNDVLVDSYTENKKYLLNNLWHKTPQWLKELIFSKTFEAIIKKL